MGVAGTVVALRWSLSRVAGTRPAPVGQSVLRGLAMVTLRSLGAGSPDQRLCSPDRNGR